MRTLPGAHPGTGVSAAAARALRGEVPFVCDNRRCATFFWGAAELCNVLSGMQWRSYGVLEG